MMDGIRSLLGTPGPSGFGSKDTAETVSDGVALHGRTIIVTGNDIHTALALLLSAVREKCFEHIFI